jgi:hypothetical protein
MSPPYVLQLLVKNIKIEYYALNDIILKTKSTTVIRQRRLLRGVTMP